MPFKPSLFVDRFVAGKCRPHIGIEKRQICTLLKLSEVLAP